MIRAYSLYTGSDKNSHVKRGFVEAKRLIEAESIEFKESPPHSSLDWHNAPAPQFVLFLSGALEFAMHSGEVFTVQPGEVLIALDQTGTGHRWRIVNHQPWSRAYVIFKQGADLPFVEEQ